MRSTTSWRAEIDGKSFSGMIEIGRSFWAIWLRAQSGMVDDVAGFRRLIADGPAVGVSSAPRLMRKSVKPGSIRAEIAIHEGAYDERAGVILSMVEGDTDGAFALTEETKLSPTA